MLSRIKRTTAAVDATQKIESARDLDELARAAIAQLCVTYHCDPALVLSQPPSSEAMCWAGSPATLPELTLPGLPARIDESNLTGRALKTGKTVSITETGIGANGVMERSAFIATPLKNRGTTLGVLQLSGAALNLTGPGAVAALEAWADKIATAIANLQKSPAAEQPARAPAPLPGNLEASARLNLKQVYDATYHGVCDLLVCDAFFIALYDDKTDSGEFVFRIEQDAELPPERFALDEGMVAYVIHNRCSIVVAEAAQETRFQIRRWGGPHAVRSLVCVPMSYADRTIGVLSVQSYQPNAYTDADIKVLNAFASPAALAIHNARLFVESQRKVDQLAVLNEVTRIVSSTIEISRLLDLIYAEVHRLLPAADSYFVALIDPEKQMLSVEMMVDDGERFEPTAIPLGNGLASLVIQRRAPLLLRNVAEQVQLLGITPAPLGKPKISSSWLGVPMITSEHLLGLLAVASYRVDAFDESDQEILQSVATQAAIAIDNARHHAEVEQQARHDSLTGALNHGYFLTRLREELERAEKNQTSLALIMLDIDHFKDYNDSYGHLVGDTILRAMVQVILSIIEATDLVGRWGGEEFIIALPGCDKSSARLVAERIRTKLAEVKLEGAHGRAVPVPTLSQGIAMFPNDAAGVFALVDVADACLYRAKNRGRDQITVAGD